MNIKVNSDWSGLAMLLVIVIPWLMGVVLAKGVFSTFVSVVFAPYAWYLVVERVMQLSGLI